MEDNTRINSHIEEFKNLQEKYRLFLDLEEDEVRKEYLEDFPKGSHYLDFLCMICDMTKEENIMNESIVMRQWCDQIDRLSCGCRR